MTAHSAGAGEYTNVSQQRGKPLPQRMSRYDTKQSDDDDDVPIILELWGMRSIALLPSLPGPLYPGVVAPDRVLSMGQMKLFDI